MLRYSHFLVLWCVVSLTNAVHLDNFSQRTKSKSDTKLKQLKQTPNLNAARHQTTKNETTNTKNVSEKPTKSVKQLQLEIQELRRMQEQLKVEIVNGKSNAQKQKLLQHIKAQIHLRKIQLGSQQQQPRQQQPTKTSRQNENHVKQAKQQTHAMQSLKRMSEPQYLQQKPMAMSQHKLKQQRNIQEKAHAVEPSQTLKQRNKEMHHVQQQNQTQQKHRQQQLQQYQEQQQKQQQKQYQQQQQQQHYQQQQFKQQNQDQNSQQLNNVQAGSSGLNTALNTLKQVRVGSNNNEKVVSKNQPMLNPNLVQTNNMIHQQQAQYQVQQMVPQGVMQQRMIQNSYPRQFNLIGQQPLGMNQAVLQSGAQQLLVPLNALNLNGGLSSQILPNERIIVVEAVRDNNGQLKIQNPANIEGRQPITPEGQTVSHATTNVHTRPMTTTPSTTTTAATTTTETTAPIPPTTYSYIEETTPVDTETFKKEFYKGEIRRQKLEIRKLQLEIRALQRNEVKSMTPGENESEEAPRKARIRFGPRQMPFAFI